MTESDKSNRDGQGDAGRGWSIRWSAVLRDLVVVAVWVLLVTFAFGILRWPSWAYYVVVFGGILLYSLAGDPWAGVESRS